ncbi:PIG-L deacetylase family protein [Frondihabitans cladoniiphilus]|uniref:PIG-L deacetylase family protein n=1 Tax=Frondihabitans cladoniiphilus TaxID=715785 RepID=UPI0031E689EC
MSFDARDPGTANATWLSDPRLHALPRLDLAGVTDLVVLSAHPDDETLGAGGTIALARSQGIPVTIVVVTDGAASEAGRDDLAAIRAAEMREAAGMLGAGPPRLLGFPDGGVREAVPEVTRAVDEVLSGHPTALVLAPWRGDGHRDHRIVGEIAAALAEGLGLVLWEYPVWMWHWGSPAHPDVPWDRLRGMPLVAYARGAKGRALGAFESQVSARSGESGGGAEPPVLHERFLANFDRAAEVFVVG